MTAGIWTKQCYRLHATGYNYKQINSIAHSLL
uniref:Uncharacterized protein n=1 Tax=Anguilla anguilla TaxID=7936 RepID=A0A0E9UMK5_ANGAN